MGNKRGLVTIVALVFILLVPALLFMKHEAQRARALAKDRGDGVYRELPAELAATVSIRGRTVHCEMFSQTTSEFCELSEHQKLLLALLYPSKVTKYQKDMYPPLAELEI